MLNYVQNIFMRKSFLDSKLRKTPRPKIDLNHKIKKIWVRKSDLTCLASFICLRACATNSWYFDSDCSRHMTGDKSILVNYKSVSDGFVTFGDGVQGKILEKGTLNIEGLPKLKRLCMLKS